MIEQGISRELTVFLVMTLSGACSVMLFDMMRSLRAQMLPYEAAVHITDALFWIAAAALGAYLVIRFNDGVLRFYELVGAVCGGCIYEFTIGRYVSFIFDGVFKILHKIIVLFFKILLTPIDFLYKILLGLLLGLRKIFKDKGKMKNGKKAAKKTQRS